VCASAQGVSVGRLVRLKKCSVGAGFSDVGIDCDSGLQLGR